MKYFRLLALGTLALLAVTTLNVGQSLGKEGKGGRKIPLGVGEGIKTYDELETVQAPSTQGQESQPTPSTTEKEAQPRFQRPDVIPPPVNGQKPCSQTIVLSAAAPAPTTPNPTDFPPSPPPPTIVSPNFGFSTPNTHLRHTFSFPGPCREGKCCEIQRATLELQVKALQAGQSQQSSDAGNDKWYIYKNGTLLASGYIWSNFPVTAGQTQTLTIPIQPAWLNGCRLSFMTQDDTSVMAAKLRVIGCCVRPNMSTTAP